MALTLGSGPIIRRGVVGDIPDLLLFWSLAGENEHRPTDDAEVVRTLLARDPDALIVAERDGAIIGTVIAGWDGWRAHLYRWAVHPDVRRQGVGRRLVDEAEEHLRAQGARRFDAMVLSGNARGEEAWSSRGYEPQAEWVRWVRRADA